MKEGDGVEHFTHRSDSRHRGDISLVEEPHHKVSAISGQPMKQPYCVLLASVGALSRLGWPCTKDNSSKRFRCNCKGLDRQHRSLFPPISQDNALHLETLSRWERVNVSCSAMSVEFDLHAHTKLKQIRPI